MSLATRSTRSALFLGASTIINIAIGFLGGIVLARLLAPNDFGTFALALTLGAFVDIRAKLQLDQKFLRDQDERPDHLDTFFTLSVGLAGVSFCFLLVGAAGVTFLSRPDLGVCLVVIGVLNLIDPFSTAIRLSIERQVAFRAISFIQTLVSLTQFITTLFAAIAGMGLWSLLLGAGIGALVNLVLFLQVAPHRPALRMNRGLAREFLAYGVKYGFVYATSAIILTQFDNFIIGLISGTYLLGLYDRAYRTSSWPTLLVSTALGRISLPTYSKLHDEPARLSYAFSLVLWTVLTLTTPIALVLLVTAPELVPTVYGDRWLPSVPILQVLAGFAIFRPLWDDMVSILIATRRPGQMARLVFIQAMTLIILAVPLTRLFGAIGTAISVGFAFLISAGFLLYFGHIHLKVNLLEFVGLPLFNNAVALAIYLLIRSLLPLAQVPSLLRLGAEAALLLGLYALVSLTTSRDLIFNRTRYLVQTIRG